ncbi:hypothetical protein KP509_14G066800 [Ceratopteris richardii]|uniref:Drought induced 19 protein type zinc-binding domain-containing protein n=1 Tax=Ceratopteris richardii TaxID=49495 RepID=A0A8T2TCR1_CERRI|nr:hypothetical protein KP509_14G066800 [Ceratopteris richardii]
MGRLVYFCGFLTGCVSLHYDDFEGDTDALFEFSCPFCYLEFDIGSLCSHLEEVHNLESKSVICPVCAVKTGADVVGHITHQHGHLFRMQRRRRARKSSSSSFASISLDPLLSSLLNGISTPESESEPFIAKKEAITNASTNQKLGSSEHAEGLEHKIEEALSRAKFVQQMVLSTIFGED